MKTKNYNMELVRTISFVMVILIHVTNYYCRAYTEISRGEYLFSLILDTISRVSVPCFFMLSGALLLGRTERLKKNGERLLRFLMVLAFWSIVYYFFNVYYMETPYNLSTILFEPTEPHLWYLYATIPIYMVLPFFQIMCRGMSANMDKAFLLMGSVAALFLYASSMMHEEAYYDIPIIGDRVYTFYFFIGYFVCKYREKIKRSIWQILGIFLASTSLNVILTVWMSYRKGDHYERFLEYGCPLVIISGVAFFVLIMQIADGHVHFKENTRKWIDRWCSCSFGIYVIHILFLDNYKKYVAPEDVAAWIAVPVLTLVILTASFACIYVIRKLPFGKYIT